MRDYARNIFRFNFRNDDVCFFVWIYEMEQFKLKVGRCFALISNHLGGFDLFITGRRHFLLSERSLSFNNVMITLTSARPSARTVELASANRDWACLTDRCHTLSNKTSLQKIGCKSLCALYSCNQLKRRRQG